MKPSRQRLALQCRLKSGGGFNRAHGKRRAGWRRSAGGRNRSRTGRNSGSRNRSRTGRNSGSCTGRPTHHCIHLKSAYDVLARWRRRRLGRNRDRASGSWTHDRAGSRTHDRAGTRDGDRAGSRTHDRASGSWTHDRAGSRTHDRAGTRDGDRAGSRTHDRAGGSWTYDRAGTRNSGSWPGRRAHHCVDLKPAKDILVGWQRRGPGRNCDGGSGDALHASPEDWRDAPKGKEPGGQRLCVLACGGLPYPRANGPGDICLRAPVGLEPGRLGPRQVRLCLPAPCLRLLAHPQLDVLLGHGPALARRLFPALRGGRHLHQAAVQGDQIPLVPHPRQLSVNVRVAGREAAFQ